MKRLITTLVLLAVCVSSYAGYMFDTKNNNDLRADMLSFLGSFKLKVASQPIYADLCELEAEVKAVMNEQPYAWLEQVSLFVSEKIREYPPVLDYSYGATTTALIRRNLLTLRDYPMHEVSHTSDQTDEIEITDKQAQAFERAIDNFFKGSVDGLMKWLDEPAPEAGKLRIYKVYNMGYVFRTCSSCWAVDIHWWGTSEQAAKLMDKIEALFLTHAHGDHYNKDILQKFTAMPGKVFYTPKHLTNYITLSKGARIVLTEDDMMTPDYFGSTKVRSTFGGQGTTPCNLYCIESDGWTIWHGGDMSTPESVQRAAQNFPAPDAAMFIMAASISDYFSYIKTAEGYSEKLPFYILSHENEVHHTISGRVSFKYWFESPYKGLKSAKVCENVPWFLPMDCGEQIELSR